MASRNSFCKQVEPGGELNALPKEVHRGLDKGEDELGRGEVGSCPLHLGPCRCPAKATRRVEVILVGRHLGFVEGRRVRCPPVLIEGVEELVLNIPGKVRTL